jgi:hypothetical protein
MLEGVIGHGAPPPGPHGDPVDGAAAAPVDDPADAEALARHAAALADAIADALPGWVRRCVGDRLAAAGIEPDAAVDAATEDAAQRCAADVGPSVRALLADDVDRQRTTPLALLRAAVAHPTAVLRAAGVPPVVRDDFAARSFPDDDYDLTPASFADVDPSLHEPGLVWGAAKAHVHRRRHRPQR